MIKRGEASSSYEDDRGYGSEDEPPVTRVLRSTASPDPSPDARYDVHELTVGWLVVIDGPGRGCSVDIYSGMNSIGRNGAERIPLDFGDESISREAHAYVIYDEKQNSFFIQHGGKSNLVRLNDDPVLAPLSIKRGDTLEIGKTKLVFVPFCDDNFVWDHSV